MSDEVKNDKAEETAKVDNGLAAKVRKLAATVEKVVKYFETKAGIDFDLDGKVGRVSVRQMALIAVLGIAGLLAFAESVSFPFFDQTTFGTAVVSGDSSTGKATLTIDYAVITDGVTLPAGSIASDLPSGKIYVGNAGGTSTAVTVSGQLSLSNTGVATIGTNTITSARIVDGTIVNADIGTSAAIAASKVNTAGAVVTCGGLVVSTNATIGGTLTAPVLATATIASGTTNLTLTSTYYGKVILCAATNAVAITLPANGAAAGSWFDLMITGDNNSAPTIAAATTDTLRGPNDVDLKSVTFGSGHRIGAYVKFISDGSFWNAINVGSTTMTSND